jgi:hypothetical protein
MCNAEDAAALMTRGRAELDSLSDFDLHDLLHDLERAGREHGQSDVDDSRTGLAATKRYGAGT